MALIYSVLYVLYALRAETMLSDLTFEQPLWLLSSYGSNPLLFSGPGIEESPEELRIKYIIAVEAGTQNNYVRIPDGGWYLNNAVL